MHTAEIEFTVTYTDPYRGACIALIHEYSLDADDFETLVEDTRKYLNMFKNANPMMAYDQRVILTSNMY